uniref:Phosphatidic acid phosphatase type 2/haloperoxidase domain-containing protein n=1 Tax=Plectus sambesii TaxID=2011161 RepID=A0A914X3W2_9BILA
MHYFPNVFIRGDDVQYMRILFIDARPSVEIIIGEVMFWLFSTKPRKTVYANCKECKVHLFTRRVLRFISVFMFGALIVQIFVDTIKLITGYQRPYFLSLCNVTIPRCTAPLEHSPSPSPHRACLFDRDADALRYAWLTFPSLFAAFSSYSAIFASLYVFYMVSLRGAPLLRPFLICGFLGMAIIASFSRIQGYKNHWRDIWVGWIIGAIMAFFLCYAVLCFQEVYHIIIEKPPVEERISPFFSWFRLPRVQAPSLKEEYVVYEEDQPPPPTRHRQRNQDRTYEVTTTTESFQRTIAPPHQNGHGYGPQY